MSYKIELDLFHNCEARGDRNTVDAPFLSKEKDQWLSQGYYFWTDDAFYAKKWGKGKRYVYQFKYIIDREYVLDLVGSVRDQLAFIEEYLATYDILIKSVPALKKYQHQDIAVGVIIEILRRYGEFPYHAIKAYDITYKSAQTFPYIGGRPEKAVIPTRQQIVIFENFLTDDLKQSKQFLCEVEV